jgi:5-oxoprolinase (ATP-hydrolysing)
MSAGRRALAPLADPVRLELFTNRFSAVARDMGEVLRRSALSTNVKERLDFSCALLDAGGSLVVNAPHIPVHLGALGLCVRRVAAALEMAPGDVVVTNHPGFGGSHLPDVTVITPIFSDGDAAEEEAVDDELPRLLGYAASRAHHAEIGGCRPGSMPPDATRLADEGVVLPPMHLVRRGESRWDAVRRRLAAPPWPSRAPDENLADLAAAVAANRRGAAAVARLAGEHGADTLAAAMAGIEARAETLLRRALARLAAERPGRREAEDRLDDGAALRVAVELLDGARDGQSAASRPLRLDFTGSAPVHPGNLNATPAIVRSVVLYVLRLLVGEPLPLNEGLARPVELIVPEGMLAPPFPDDPALCPAVVGGNVETSQRLVDLLLAALGLMAASQGTMNNLLFGAGAPPAASRELDVGTTTPAPPLLAGDAPVGDVISGGRGASRAFGYYETVAGGCGAGPGFAGASAVHSHMTNTRATDPELLERRYPVRLERFAIRRGSGGTGRWPGGDGVVRELVFLAPLSLSLLTQHRTAGPRGAAGGHPGAPGRQRLVRADGTAEDLPPIAGRDLAPGDRLILETPGGGAWGPPDPSPPDAKRGLPAVAVLPPLPSPSGGGASPRRERGRGGPGPGCLRGPRTPAVPRATTADRARAEGAAPSPISHQSAACPGTRATPPPRAFPPPPPPPTPPPPAPPP